MKNRLFIVSILALSLFATTACTNWLDTRPESEMILDEYWTTESEAEAVLMAAYRGFITSDCTYRMLVWGELRSDNFTQGTGIGDEINKVLRQEITPSTPYTTWSSFYSVINYCNTFLSFAPDVLKKDDNFTVEKLRKLSAEAYAVRALAYFYLVRAFQNVPWISEPSLDDTQDFIVPQFSERAVLDSIIRDLELYSLPYIPRIHSTDKETKGRFTKTEFMPCWQISTCGIINLRNVHRCVITFWQTTIIHWYLPKIFIPRCSTQDFLPKVFLNSVTITIFR